METIKTIIRHNQGMAISICIALVLVIWFFGCQSKTQSLLHPQEQVTEGMLQVEYKSEIRRLENDLATLKATAELRLQDLHRQDKIKQGLFESAKLIADSNNPNPLGILSMLGTVFGIGAVIDNRRKDMLITSLQKKDSSGQANADTPA